MANPKTNRRFKGDRGIVIVTLLLCLISFLASITTMNAWGGHLLFLITAILCMFLFYKIDYSFLSSLSNLGLLIALVLLILTRILGGFDARGLQIGSFGIQTLYFIGFLVVFYISKYLALRMNKGETISRQETIKLFLIVVGFCAGIFTSKQSTGIILFMICWILMFLGGVKLKYLTMLVAIGACLVGIVVAVGAFRSTTLENRIYIWAHNELPEDCKKEEQYRNYGKQMIYSKAMVARAHFFPKNVGRGILKTDMPARHNDYVYAVIVEEFGILVGIIILSFYLILLYRALRIAKKVEGPFAKMLAAGIGLWVTYLALIHIGVNCSLIPHTGETLPLISSGGAGIIVTGIVLGILLNISRYCDDTENIELLD